MALLELSGPEDPDDVLDLTNAAVVSRSSASNWRNGIYSQTARREKALYGPSTTRTGSMGRSPRSTARTAGRELRRRSAIEPIIGHMKAEGHLDAATLAAVPGTLPASSSQPSATISAASSLA